MPRLSDIIETFIKEMLVSGGGETEIQRNDIASKFNCVPSQINYVIDTRFTSEQGYYVESRRGGGGCIIIRQVAMDKSSYIMHIINNIGDSISQMVANAFINNFIDYGIINKRESYIMRAALSDKSLDLPIIDKDIIRAKVLKNMLITLISSNF